MTDGSDSPAADDPPTQPRKRTWRFRLVAVALAVLFTLIVGEIAARLLYPDPALFDRRDRWVAHEKLGRRLRPNHSFTSGGVEYATNSLGLRDRERPPAAPDGTLRMVVVGDSFVYGVGRHEDMFPQVTERLLHESGATNLEVMPVGQPGYGTLQQVDFLNEFLLDHRFDVLVLAFCVGNDLSENFRALRGSLPKPPETSFGQGLAESLRLYQAYLGFKRALSKSGHEKFDGHVRKRMRLAQPSTYEDPEWQKAESETVAAIERMQAFARHRKAEFVVVFLPDEYQFDSPLRERLLPPGAEIQPRLVQERLSSRLTERGIEVLDPFDAFAAAHAPGKLFIPFDTHFDAAGNRLLAEELARWTQASGLLK